MMKYILLRIPGSFLFFRFRYFESLNESIYDLHGGFNHGIEFPSAFMPIIS